jgi:hypothetical protein
MTAQSVAVAAVQNTAVVTGACTLRGFAISSTAGADVVIYDNTAASGLVLAQFTLAAKGFQAVDISDGVRCTTGIYVSSTAAVQGHVRIG